MLIKMKRHPDRKHQVLIIALLLLMPLVMYGKDPRGQLRERIVETAKKYLGLNYSYGGNGKKGFDCSGFSRYVYAQIGIKIPRTSLMQYSRGKKISLKEARAGDLIFFAIKGRRISHVGIYLGNLRFIHSPRTGRRISIASINTPYWKKRFMGAVRYIE